MGNTYAVEILWISLMFSDLVFSDFFSCCVTLIPSFSKSFSDLTGLLAAQFL